LSRTTKRSTEGRKIENAEKEGKRIYTEEKEKLGRVIMQGRTG